MIERRWIVELCVLIVGALLCVGSPPALTGTRASWSDSVSQTVSISSARTAPPVFRPGTSRATYVSHGGPFPLIAHVDGAAVSLDFGEIGEGNTNNSPKVLFIDNPGPGALTLAASLSGDIVGLVREATLSPATLAAGQTATLAMKLDAHGATVGSHEGTITISDASIGFSKAIPVRVTVVSSGGAGLTALEQQVTSDPVPSGSSRHVAPETDPALPAPSRSPSTTPAPTDAGVPDAALMPPPEAPSAPTDAPPAPAPEPPADPAPQPAVPPPAPESAPPAPESPPAPPAPEPPAAQPVPAPEPPAAAPAPEPPAPTPEPPAAEVTAP
ncbi:MAG TPA: hypothetical protein VF902_04870 [Coriobacteriia bacterium]